MWVWLTAQSSIMATASPTCSTSREEIEETDSGADSTQSVFERAVRHHLPSSFVTLLDRVDDFSVGKVLVLHKKPHFWRRAELDFTSLDLETLLTKSQDGFKIQTERKKLYDQSSDASNRMIKLDLGLDAELKTRWADFGGDLKGGGTKLLNLYVDFGRIDHILSNLPQILMGQQWIVDSDHIVMKDALAKGKEFFVITSVYEAQKAFVKVSHTHKGQDIYESLCCRLERPYRSMQVVVAMKMVLLVRVATIPSQTRPRFLLVIVVVERVYQRMQRMIMTSSMLTLKELPVS